MAQLLTVACVGWEGGFEPVHRYLNTLLVPKVVVIEDRHHWEEVLKMPFGAMLSVMCCVGKSA